MQPTPNPNDANERFQGTSGLIIAGIGAALGFGLVTWWQSHEIGLTVMMAMFAFIVGVGTTYWSRRGRR